MAAHGKYRLLVIVGILLPMIGICVFTFLMGPTLIGERQAAKIGSTLGCWFLVYLLVVVASVIARELRGRKTK
jgi:uncharacterized membrane protein